jgi:site-specific DNA-methyltransferase (adenine-specific)
VLTYGTGGLNIDGSRIGYASDYDKKHQEDIRKGSGTFFGGNGEAKSEQVNMKGRWPANLIIDQDTAELLDEQSGQLSSGKLEAYHNRESQDTGIYGQINGLQSERGYGDTGGASRFFYVAKASKRDRNEGLEDLENGDTPYRSHRPNFENTKGVETPFAGAGRSGQNLKNFHPTVKPTQLMQYLVKLITPQGGTVLDPFTGSGSTGKAAILEGFDFIGIELTEDYWPIIEGRLKHAEAKVAEAKVNIEAQPQGLF